MSWIGTVEPGASLKWPFQVTEAGADTVADALPTVAIYDEDGVLKVVTVTVTQVAVGTYRAELDTDAGGAFDTLTAGRYYAKEIAVVSGVTVAAVDHFDVAEGEVCDTFVIKEG